MLKLELYLTDIILHDLDEDENANSNAVLQRIKESDFSVYDIVVLSDYNKGTLDNARQIIKHINKFNCKVVPISMHTSMKVLG